MDIRKTIIDILLSTRSLPEGVAADAIISAIGSGSEEWEIGGSPNERFIKLMRDITEREEDDPEHERTICVDYDWLYVRIFASWQPKYQSRTEVADKIERVFLPKPILAAPTAKITEKQFSDEVMRIAYHERKYDASHNIRGLAASLWEFIESRLPAPTAQDSKVPNLTRYDTAISAGSMEECQTGEWVLFSDVEAMLSDAPTTQGSNGEEDSQ